VPVDFCLVCATHHKLREAAEQGRFRNDLYYRINGLTVQLPALRERTDFAALTDITEALLDDAVAAATPGPEAFQSLDALSRAAIQQALEQSHGNVSSAARALGISRQTLYRKLAAGALH
jgi:transcriptional regulator of acetoin/glycerol metabolism